MMPEPESKGLPPRRKDALDLLLINPNGREETYQGLGEDLTAVEPPLWCRLIAGYVRDHGHSVEIMDAEALRLSALEVSYRVHARRPRLVCIAAYGHQPSASTQQMPAAIAVANTIRNTPYLPEFTKPRVIMVGGHVSALPQRTMAEAPIDYACVGEGPVTVEELLAGKYACHEIRGLVWRDSHPQQRVHINPSAPLLTMDQLHGNAWDLLPMDKYRAHNWQCFGDLSKRAPYASIHTSLGCPYRCSFCCINAPFGGNQYRLREPIAVVKEIAHLYQNHGVSTFKITDEMFVLNETHYTKICELLAEAEVGELINIWAYARVDTVKPHTLKMMRKAGIRWLALGIESGSAHVRQGASKSFGKHDIADVVRAIQAAGINVIGNYIFGLPDDTIKTMKETLSLAIELNTEFANFYTAMAYPGSALYDQAVDKGWTLPESWSGYSQHSYDCRPLDTATLDAATVLQFRDDAFWFYFTSGRYLAMVERKFGKPVHDHVIDMCRRKLRRKLIEDRDAAGIHHPAKPLSRSAAEGAHQH